MRVSGWVNVGMGSTQESISPVLTSLTCIEHVIMNEVNYEFLYIYKYIVNCVFFSIMCVLMYK